MYSVQAYDHETGWSEIGAAVDPDHAVEIAEDIAGEDLEFTPHIFETGDGMLSDPDSNGIVYRLVRLESME